MKIRTYMRILSRKDRLRFCFCFLRQGQSMHQVLRFSTWRGGHGGNSAGCMGTSSGSRSRPNVLTSNHSFVKRSLNPLLLDETETERGLVTGFASMSLAFA